MTIIEAKEILLRYRADSPDAGDPEFAEALALARQDAELMRWFEQQQAVHDVLRQRFAGIKAPAGLKEQIVSEHQARQRATWRRQPMALAAAAAILICAGFAVLWFQNNRADSNEVSFDTFRKRVVREVLRSYTMTLESGDANAIQQHLAQNKSPTDYQLPQTLKDRSLVGCGSLTWRHKSDVSMICFRTGKPLASTEKSDLFLFVVDRKAVEGVPKQTGTKPVFTQVKSLATASWAEGDRIYVLATPGNESDVRQYF